MSDPLSSLLREHGLRVTPQRQAILEAFRATPHEHLSAEEVASRASARVPSIGRGTVYATLAELTELGLLAATGTTEPIRYETNLSEHDHFRCRLCLRLYDVELGGRSLRGRSLPGFSIEDLAVHAEGICENCQAYQRGLSDGARQTLTDATLAEDALGGLSFARLESRLGDLALVASAEGIVHLAFADHADFTGLLGRARRPRGSTAGRARLTACAESLAVYLAGGRTPIADQIDWRLLDDVQHETLTAVQRIPYAQPCSYDRLGSALDPYECGRLMGANPLPLLVPCHRVTRGSERPAVWVGGAERLHALQALEAGEASSARD